MYSNGKYLCDAEVGHYKRGWHGCRRTAVVRCDGEYIIDLHYCAKHQTRAIKNIKLLCSEYTPQKALPASPSANLGRGVTPAVAPAKLPRLEAEAVK